MNSPTTKNMLRGGALCAAIVLVGGCADTGPVKRLVYAKNFTVGINISTVNTSTPDFTVGVRSQNVVIVPAYDDESNKLVHGSVGDKTPQDTDALSVLGQFEVDTKATGVALGEFFATGLAAQKLADGFACKLSDGKAKEICAK